MFAKTGSLKISKNFFLAVIFIFSVFGKNAHADIEGVVIRGAIVPVGEFGHFYIAESAQHEDLEIHEIVNLGLPLFRLRGVEIGNNSLRSHTRGNSFTCETVGSVAATAIPNLSIAICRNQHDESLVRQILDSGDGQIICSELRLLSQICE